MTEVEYFLPWAKTDTEQGGHSCRPPALSAMTTDKAETVTLNRHAVKGFERQEPLSVLGRTAVSGMDP